MRFFIFTFVILALLLSTKAYPTYFPSLSDEDYIEDLEKNPHRIEKDPWFENQRYTREAPEIHHHVGDVVDPKFHEAHHPHVGDVHPENIRAQLEGGDKIVYEHVDVLPTDVDRLNKRQVHLIPPGMTAEVVNGDHMVDEEKAHAEELMIKKAVKRRQVLVQSSLYEKDTLPDGRAVEKKIEKGQ